MQVVANHNILIHMIILDLRDKLRVVGRNMMHIISITMNKKNNLKEGMLLVIRKLKNSTRKVGNMLKKKDLDIMHIDKSKNSNNQLLY